MLKFLTPRKAPIVVRTPDDMIKWVQLKKREGTTALVPYDRQARPGWKITHKVLGRVKLLGTAGDGKLKVESLHSVEQMIVDAAECGEPISAPVKVTSTEEETVHEWFRDVWLPRILEAALERAEPRHSNAARKQPILPAAAPTVSPTVPPTAPTAKPTPRPRGRPRGSRDKVARTRSKPSLNITWKYTGKCGPPGPQFATIGESAVQHDSIPSSGIVVQQPNLVSLILQLGNGSAADIMTVAASAVRAVVSGEGREATVRACNTKRGPDSLQKPRRKRMQDGPSRAAQLQSTSLTKTVTKRVAEETRKRKRREETAASRGRPLKAPREQKNRRWEDAYKLQALTLYKAKFSETNDYAGCQKELAKLPGFEGVTPSNVRSWVLAETKTAKQVPNELGLIVTAKGRKPALTAEMYAELVQHIRNLAKTRAFTMTATTLRPITLAFIANRLGPASVWSRPGSGGFSASYTWQCQLAHDASLRWRKPFGDARKAPPNAAELIRDMVLRLAYLMHEYDIPPCLVLNFDHTGLHFMQMRGNTWTVVEEDTDVAHQSRPHKGKEVKQQNKGDKRQATGTVGTSMAGDVLPAQLLTDGVETRTGALPIIDGIKYVKLMGTNKGHGIGVRAMDITTAAHSQHIRDTAKLVSSFLGHLGQTSNHWANIKTSYAILEYIIIPWLLQKKRAIGKRADALCILIVDCWYGWKDQDKKKTLITFRHYVRNHYPWLRLVFVPAACTDLVQPADRGCISWLKANMRAFYTDVIAKVVIEQLASGVPLSEIKIDTSAPYLKAMLAKSFAHALSQLPCEKVLHCWAPLQDAWDKKEVLHAEAKEKLAHLFPNSVVDVGPAETEPEPDPIINDETGDDFETTTADEGTAESNGQHARLVAMAEAVAAARAAVAGATAAIATAHMGMHA